MNKPISKPQPVQPVVVEVIAVVRVITFNCANRQIGFQIRDIANQFGECNLSVGNTLVDDQPVSYRLTVSSTYNFSEVCDYLKEAAANIDKVAAPKPVGDVVIEFEHVHLIPSSRSIEIYCVSLGAWHKVSKEFTCFGNVIHLPNGVNGCIHLRLNVAKTFNQHEVWKYLCGLFPQVPEKTK